MKIVYIIVLFMQIGGILTEEVAGLENLEKLCRKNGGANAVAKIRNGVADFQGCVQATVIEWTTEIQRTGKVEAGFELVCSKIDNPKACIKRFTNTAKTCFKPDQYETIDLGYKTTAAGLQFGCDNIDDIKKAMSSNDVSCVSSKKSAFTNCVERFNSSRNHQSVVDPVAAMESFKVTYDAKGCSDLLGLERCTIKALAECRDQSFSHLLETMWKYVNNELPCDNLPKSKASTTAGVVGVLLLMTAAIHVYL